MSDDTRVLVIPANAPPPVAQLGEMLNAKMQTLVEAAPAALAKHMDPLRIAKLSLQAYMRNPALMECSPASYAMALYDAIKFGLDPMSPHGYAYLIPRRNKRTGRKEVNFQVGYKGYLHLARKLGMVRDARANVVVAGEPFEADFVEGKIIHKWSAEVDHTDESKYVAAYCIAWPTDGSERAHFCVLDRQQVHKRRAVAQTMDVWNAWPDRQWRKTAVSTLFRGGEIEIDPVFASLMDYDTEQEVGETRTMVAASGVGAVKAALGIAVDPVEASLPSPEPAEMPLEDAPVYGDPTDEPAPAPAPEKPQPMQRTALQVQLAAEWKASGRPATEFPDFAMGVIGKMCADDDADRQKLVDALLSGGGA